MSLWVALAVAGWIWVIWPFSCFVHALKIQNYTIPLREYDPRRFLREESNHTSYAELYIAESRMHAPEHVYSVLASQTYLVPHTALRPGMRVAPYHPQYKYPPALMNQTLFMIRVSNNETVVTHPKCTVKPWFQDRFLVNCTNQGAAVSLATRSDVLWVSQAPLIRPIRPNSRLARETLVPTSYPSGIGLGRGLGTRAVVSDTGLDYYHCMFYSATGTVPLGYISLTAHPKILGILNYPGYTDFYANDNAHGTSTVSVLAGSECLGEMGIAPDAKVAFIDVSPEGQETILLPPNFFSMLANLHTDYGITVHSGSWGSVYGAGTYDDICNLVDTQQYAYPHLTHVYSAGNSGDPMSPPASAKSPITAGATTYNLDHQTDFSSTGLLLDGRMGPIVMAPGRSVTTAYALAEPDPDHADFRSKSGTSFSGPIIAGLVLLFEEFYRATSWDVPPTSALNAAMLMSHAQAPTLIVDDNDQPVSGGAITTYGTPLINPYRLFSLDLISIAEAPDVVTRKSICISSGEEDSLTPHVFTVTWTDVPAATYAERTLINDIDVVILSDVTVYWSEDGVNPHERIPGVVGSWYRVVMFPYDNRTTLGPVTVALHATLLTASSAVQVGGTCGTCLPAETQVCAGGLEYCLLNGEFSPCIVPTMSPSAVWSNDTNATCVSAYATETRVHMVSGSCLAIACEAGYYIQDDACICVENSFVECVDEGPRSYKMCTSVNDYGLCSDSSRYLIKSDAGGNLGGDVQLNLIMLILYALILVGII